MNPMARNANFLISLKLTRTPTVVNMSMSSSVVPRYLVVTEETKQAVLIFLEPSPIAGCRFGLMFRFRLDRLVEYGVEPVPDIAWVISPPWRAFALKRKFQFIANLQLVAPSQLRDFGDNRILARGCCEMAASRVP